MHWEIILIPLIAFGAWVLATLFKTEDQKAKQQPRFRPGGFDPRAQRRPPAQPSRSAEQAREQRAVAAGMQAMPAPPPRSAKPQPIIAPRRSPPQRRQVPVIATVIEEIAIPVERPPDALAVPIKVPFSADVVPAAPLNVVTPRPRTPPSPVLQEVVRLLKSPNTAGTAVVLSEILNRPRGRRI